MSTYVVPYIWTFPAVATIMIKLMKSCVVGLNEKLGFYAQLGVLDVINGIKVLTPASIVEDTGGIMIKARVST